MQSVIICTLSKPLNKHTNTNAVLCVSAGQFQHADVSLAEVQDYMGRGAHKEAISARGILRSGSERVPVILQDKTLKDTVQKRHADKCWVVPKAQVERLLGHPYESYVVDHV